MSRGGPVLSARATSGDEGEKGQRMAVVERVEAAPGERRRLRLANPATLEPLGELEIDGPEHVRAAVERARKAQIEWGAASFRERAHFLDRAARLLAKSADELAARST